MWSLKARVTLGLCAVLLYGLIAIAVSLSLPASNYTFSQSGDALIAESKEQQAVVVNNFVITNQETIRATPLLMIEEPDVLEDYVTMNHFFATHQRLYEALHLDQLQFEDENGILHPVKLTSRSLFQLSKLFWLQLICGLSGMVICLLVWIPAKKDAAIHSFTLTGLSYVLFSSAAAIYSTRDLFISGEQFALLSGINHTGALLFSASLSAFLWNYPSKAPSIWLLRAFYFSFFIALVLDQLQLVATPVEGFHLWVMGIFVVGLLGFIWQWWRGRKDKERRRSSGWMFASIILGTFFFAGGMILPAILNTAVPASQGLLFTTFLLMYTGMAMGVVRYRLFDLDRWWFSIWAWLLSGLMLMLVDVLLVSLLSLSGPVTLTLSVVVVGWIYFPLRQYVWNRLFAQNHQELDEWLASALPAMLEAQHGRGETGIKEALQAVFNPLKIDSVELQNEPPTVQIINDGNTLTVVDPLNNKVYLLHHANEGSKLFRAKDIKTANLVLSLYKLVNQASEAYSEGVKEERYRIRRDMHDDLGAKLLHILHKSQGQSRPLVREAIRDLRNLLKDLEGESLSLDIAIKQWREEAQRRCIDNNCPLNWQSSSSHLVLSVGQFSELTRIVRESITNALKHGNKKQLSVAIHYDEHTLTLLVENEYLPESHSDEHINGLNIMAERAKSLTGTCQYQQTDNKWQVILTVPIKSFNSGELSSTTKNVAAN